MICGFIVTILFFYYYKLTFHTEKKSLQFDNLLGFYFISKQYEDEKEVVLFFVEKKDLFEKKRRLYIEGKRDKRRKFVAY
jgi:hypothetical protein